MRQRVYIRRRKRTTHFQPPTIFLCLPPKKLEAKVDQRHGRRLSAFAFWTAVTTQSLRSRGPRFKSASPALLTTETQEIESFQGESWTHGISRMFPSLLVLCCLSLTIESSHGKTIYTSTLTTHLPGFLLLPASLTPFPSFLARVICGDSQWRHVWHSPLCSGTVKRTLEKEKTLWENVFRVNRACKSSQRTPMLVFQSGFCLRDRNRRNLTFLNYPRRNPKAGSDLVNRLFRSVRNSCALRERFFSLLSDWLSATACLASHINRLYSLILQMLTHFLFFLLLH